ncbi:MAG: CPBP family intramembrane glutamic endopeptidase [Candidatus Hodarchaeales archaeon]
MHIQERYTYMNRIRESFTEDRILKATIGVWLGFVIILGFFTMGPINGILYTLWYPVMYVLIPFGITFFISKRFFYRQQQSFQNPWVGRDTVKSKLMVRLVVGYFIFCYVVIAFFPILGLPLIGIGIILVIISWIQKHEPLSPLISGQKKEYWTRLENNQKIIVFFFLLILPLLGLFAPNYIFSYLAFFFVYLFLIFLVIRGNLTQKDLSLIIINPILMMILILLPVIGTYGQKIVQMAVFQQIAYNPSEPLYDLFYRYLIVALAEQIIWRIFLQSYLELKYGGNRAIVYTSIIVTIGHLAVFPKLAGVNIFSILTVYSFIFYLSLIWGYIWHKTRCLPIIVGSHILADMNNHFWQYIS